MTNGALRTVAVAEAPSLAGKLEFAILSVLIHYNGSYDETLIDWYAALRLGLPELSHPDEVRDVFKRLSAGGIVELTNDSASGSFGDNRIFSNGPFSTALTAQGLVFWNTIRIQPRVSG